MGSGKCAMRPINFVSIYIFISLVFSIYLLLRFELVTAYVHQARKKGDADYTYIYIYKIHVCVCVCVHAKSWTNLFISIWNDKKLKSLIIKFLWFGFGWDVYTLKPLPQMIWTEKKLNNGWWNIGLVTKKIYCKFSIFQGPHHKCRMSGQFVGWEMLLLFRPKKNTMDNNRWMFVSLFA